MIGNGNNKKIDRKMLSAIVVTSLIGAIAAAAALAATTYSGLPAATAHDGFPNYADIDSATKSQTSNVLKGTVDATANIPHVPDSFIKSVLVYGYGWVDTNTGKAAVALIHPNFRDSTKSPGTWHMHPITLGQGTTKSTYCISYFGDGLTTAEGGLPISQDVMKMSVGTSKVSLNASEVDTVSSFVIQEDSSCPAIPKLIDGQQTQARLGVLVHDTINPQSTTR